MSQLSELNPADILEVLLQRAVASIEKPFVADSQIVQRIEFICRNIQNRAGSRLLAACLLAKIHRPYVDVRKPYTEIGDADTFSGRRYDEDYVGPFVVRHRLPCNPTTAFLTPAFRNRNITLTRDVNLVGRPPQLYQALLDLLDEVHQERVSAEDMLTEIIRWLVIIRNENEQRLGTLLAGLRATIGGIPLSAEAIIDLIGQHLKLPSSSRLPVLVVTAAYQAVSAQLGEQPLPLYTHNAADEQTGALGDLEIVLVADNRVITSYEMKTRRVTKDDVHRAIDKVIKAPSRVDHYVFITTESIDPSVAEYTAGLYAETGGTEFVILDCLGFLRHFLHLFHRHRVQFLDAYQALVLAEPESAVSHPLKEAFLALRQAAESSLEIRQTDEETREET